ncbi:cytochrome c oxidase subunit 3 [Nocardia sp. NPDC052112]|uniref:cytochrome c oxidase subunit 3 n=1 Tax=Nocardia sp. NPDC052112 TaxID=3155646 RepID=UPI00343C07E2
MTAGSFGAIELPGFVWDEDVPGPAPETRKEPDNGDTPGELGLWVFILGDMTLFGLFFAVFLWENRHDRLAFAESAAHLHRSIGAVNTLVLLLSSYLVVIALHAHRQGAASKARTVLVGVLGCAMVFAALKGVEYSTAITSGHVVTSNMFWTFYFVSTGIHLLHVLIGAVLVMLWREKCRYDRSATGSLRFSEIAAVYWHMVDLLWVVIFTLLYVGCFA